MEPVVTARHLAGVMAAYVGLALVFGLAFLPFGFGMRGYLIMVVTLTTVGWLSLGLHALVAWSIGHTD